MAENTRRDRGPKPSITNHRLFPLIVTLWFAALFGLTILTMRTALMESIVAATGIDSFLPMTAAPLGNTARILIVLAMTAIGGFIGSVVARVAKQVRRIKPNAKKQKASAAPVQPTQAAIATENSVDEKAEVQPRIAPSAPIVVDVADNAETSELARRRRQLVVKDVDEADERTLAEPQILSVAELPLKSFDEVDGIWLHSNESEAITDIHAPVAESDGRIEVAAEALHIDELLDAVDSQATSIELEAPVANAPQPVEEELDPRTNALRDVYAHRVNADAGRSNAQQHPKPNFVSVPLSEAEILTAQKDVPPVSTETFSYSTAADRIATAPLDTLSHVELLERLAQTIARHQAKAGPSSTQESDSNGSPQPVNEPGSATPDVVQRNMPSPQITSSTNERVADNDILISGFTALRDVIMQDTKSVGRLSNANLNPKTSPPVIPFPGGQDTAQSPLTDRNGPNFGRNSASSTDQTEQALQAALATLRKMSGAA